MLSFLILSILHNSRTVLLISTFGVMYLCCHSVDNLSLMALTITMGLIKTQGGGWKASDLPDVASWSPKSSSVSPLQASPH